VLHALIANQADSGGLSAMDCVMPVVPMFHANAWGLAFAAPMAGAKLVLPGAGMDGKSIHELLETEKVTCTSAVPTVWLWLLQYLEAENKRLSTLERVTIGGSAAPRTLVERFEKNYGVKVIHAWGMTEMSPLGTLCRFKPGMDKLPPEEQMKYKLKQGRTPFMVEMKIVDEAGKQVPRDGQTFGHLVVRGPAIAKAYFKREGEKVLCENGFFDTGDVATIDERGYMQITDRSKDMIKSGGEWISSIELENLAVCHPEVQEAAVIGVEHPKWDERPLLIVVRKQGCKLEKQAMLDYMKGHIAKWWLPDDVAFIDEIPHTAAGKINKRGLRELFKDYRLP
jgi:acyl-CoA synthetase (AMP-forming)/AMP-acid ligase II